MDFTNPAAIQHWIHHLPLGDVRSMAREIYAKVKELNNSPLVLRHHYEFLEQIGPSVHQVFTNLEKYYADAHFPLAPRARKGAGMAEDLCEMMIQSYQLLLREISSADLGQHENDPRVAVWQTAAHRILYYSQRMLITQITLDLDEHNGFWLRIYRLYLASLRLPHKQRRIDYPGIAAYPQLSIDGLTKRILLIALVPLRSLRNTQIHELLTSIDYWASLLTLPLCTRHADHRQSPFFFQPKEDLGPVHFSSKCSDCPTKRCIMITTAPITDLITRSLLQAARQGLDEIALENGQRISVSTLDALRGFWKDRPKRIDHRNETQDQVEVVFSIPGIYNALEAALEAAQAAPPPPSERPAAVTNLSSQSLEAMFAASMGSSQPSSLDVTTLNESHTSASNEPNNKGYSLHQAKVRDRSENGYRLELELTDELRLRVGEMVGIRHSPKSDVALGVVRWIKELEQHRISFGVLLIARHALHASFRAGSKALGGDQPCLIAEHMRNEKTILILNHFPLIREKLITLHYQGEPIPIAFNGWPMEESRTFEAFEFGIRRGEQNFPDPKLPMLDLMWLKALTHKEKAPPTPQRARLPKGELNGNPWRLD